MSEIIVSGSGGNLEANVPYAGVVPVDRVLKVGSRQQIEFEEVAYGEEVIIVVDEEHIAGQARSAQSWTQIGTQFAILATKLSF